jgi:hypothetical protein
MASVGVPAPDDGQTAGLPSGAHAATQSGMKRSLYMDQMLLFCLDL